MLRFRRFVGNTRGTVAIEFAVVALAFLSLLVVVFIFGLAFFFKQSLDVATMTAARQVLTGAAKNRSVDQQAFKQIVCSKLLPVMSCADVAVSLYVVPEDKTPSGYFDFVNADRSGLIVPSSASASSYQLGRRGAYQYLQVIYPFTMIPQFLLKAAPTTYSLNGKPAYALVSTAAFRNEQF